MAITLAIFCAFLLAFAGHYNRFGKRIFEFSTITLLSTPILLLGPLMIYLFGFYFDLLPVALLEKPSSYILPVLILSLKPMSSLARLLYYSINENLNLEFVLTHKSFGFSDFRIYAKYVLKNSIIPFVSYLGPLCAVMLTGSTMVEIIFALPGLGTQFVEATLNRDSSLVVGLTLFFGFFVLIFQCLVDLTVWVLDPRAKLA